MKGLAKPPLPAWTVNQLARGRELDIRRLLRAAERLREVQVSGGGDFAEAAKAEQDAVRALVRAAAEVLRDAGRPATDATLARIGQTLHAAAASEEAWADLERGTLMRELEPAGFGGLLGALPAQPARRARRRAAPDRAKEERKRAKEEVERARAEARELERAATAAEREARRARERAENAQSAVERAEQRLRGK